MTTKTANYTEKQVETMREEYSAADTVETRAAVVADIAERFKKSTRSIISKMSREGFYVKKVAVSKVTGEKAAKKEDLAVTLRAVSGLAMVSAEKMNKTDLVDLINHFEKLSEIVEIEES